MKQLKFNKHDFRKMAAFGGALMKKAKYRTARPISAKHPMHVVLRSNYKPTLGGFLNARNKKVVESQLAKLATKYGVKIYQVAINSNHIHLLVKITKRQAYAAFIRNLTGTIALKITSASKLKMLKKKFWEYRPFTRIVESFKGFTIARDYILLNQLEAFGMIPYQPNRLRNIERSYLRALELSLRKKI
jgi:putative transposase